MTTMMRHGFTLIELLMVLVIIGILGSLIFLSTRDLLYEMKVQKTATTIVSAVTTAQQAAAVRRLAHSVYFNNAIDPDDPRWSLPMTDPDRPSRRYTRERVLSGWISTGGGFEVADHRIRQYNAQGLMVNAFSGPFVLTTMGATTPSWATLEANNGRGEASLPSDFPESVILAGRWRMWTSAPNQQFLMIMGPWKSSTGEWFQAKGGMPTRKSNAPGNNITPDIDEFNRPIGAHRENLTNNPGPLGKGGIYGFPLTADGKLPSGQASAANDTVPTGAGLIPRWDPYGIALGPRLMFENGTRLLVPQDHPQFRRFARGGRAHANGPSLATATVGFNMIAAPWLYGGTRDRSGSDFNCAPSVQNINAHPDGTLGVDGCDPQRLTAPRRFEWSYGNLTALIGIATTQVVEEPMPDRMVGEAESYYQPRAITFVTVDITGMLSVERSPAFAN
jgi:prepilin-type N-terminal cleavage/methylation domain-containing protein